MTSSSTTTMPMGTRTATRRNNPQPMDRKARTTITPDGATIKTAEKARQGKRGTRMLYVLSASVLLLLILYALIGIFSDTVLVTDLGTASADGALAPGPSEAQEAVITGTR